MATIKYWDGSAWQYAVVGKQGPVGPTGPTGPAGQASLQRFRYVATGGQTSVSGTDANGNTLAYTPGLEEVFINGAAQVRGQDYTATNGTSITGITALIAGDVVEIYAWGVFNVSNTISNTLIDAKGDILAGTGADSVGRLAVGANNTVLTADSTTATGLRWGTVSAGGMTEIASGTLSGTSVSITSIPNTYKNLQLVVRNPYLNTGLGFLRLRVNNSSDTSYGRNFITTGGGTGGDGASITHWSLNDTVSPNLESSTTSYVSVIVDFYDYASTTSQKSMRFQVQDRAATFSSITGTGGFAGINTTAINSVQIITSANSFAGGTYILYGVS